MAKNQAAYVCQSCGASYGRWAGRCEACGEWNSIVEELRPTTTPGGLKGRSASRRIAFSGLAEAGDEPPRRASGLSEFDRVTGGGLVPGSAVLIGGDPGVGKSTLLLQVLASLTGQGARAAYISGEEAVAQIRLRARRLGLSDAPVALAVATSVRDILATLDTPDAPDVVVIDSIQTMYLDNLDSAPGTVAQVRGSAQELVRLAKARGFTLLLVGHVTKEGMIAGPKVLEHMVDAVLAFEGERGHQFRVLRANKNRFGPTDEIGVFEMTDGGLSEVANPSALFLSHRQADTAGAAVFAGIEGTRPVLVEVQALVSPSPFGTPRRSVVGWDSARLAMVLAVLEARCGLSLAGRDVYLNVAGGLRVSEPGADLAVAAALISASSDRPVPDDSVVFGEIGLGGEIRAVSQTNLRLKEAEKLGFRRAFLPPIKRRGAPGPSIGLTEVTHLQDLLRQLSPMQDGPVRAVPH